MPRCSISWWQTRMWCWTLRHFATATDQRLARHGTARPGRHPVSTARWRVTARWRIALLRVLFPPDPDFEETRCATMACFAPMVVIIGASRRPRRCNASGAGPSLSAAAVLYGVRWMERDEVLASGVPGCAIAAPTLPAAFASRSWRRSSFSRRWRASSSGGTPPPPFTAPSSASLAAPIRVVAGLSPGLLGSGAPAAAARAAAPGADASCSTARQSASLPGPVSIVAARPSSGLIAPSARTMRPCPQRAPCRRQPSMGEGACNLHRRAQGQDAHSFGRA